MYTAYFMRCRDTIDPENTDAKTVGHWEQFRSMYRTERNGQRNITCITFDLNTLITRNSIPASLTTFTPRANVEAIFIKKIGWIQKRFNMRLLPCYVCPRRNGTKNQIRWDKNYTTNSWGFMFCGSMWGLTEKYYVWFLPSYRGEPRARLVVSTCQRLLGSSYV